MSAAVETRWWHIEGDRVVCELCPRECWIAPGKRGFCFVRANEDGRMVLTTYGRSTGFCADPIEKKPLHHFLPGTAVLSFGTAGCNLGCQYCQNWDISKARDIELASAFAGPDMIVKAAERTGCRSIAFTYNDPVPWAEYAMDTAKAAREAGIKTVAVTAGYISEAARAEFFGQMDAANVDLKAFSEDFYHKLTLGHLQPVLDTLKWIKHESAVWLEVTTLLIPGQNDSADEVARLCEWFAGALGPDVPLHFSAFHPDYKMLDVPRTPLETLLRARQQAIDAGLRFVYIGNVDDPQHGSTYCPACRKRVIERDWYQLGEYQIRQGRCAHCGQSIPGVFEDTPGSWGRRRDPIGLQR